MPLTLPPPLTTPSLAQPAKGNPGAWFTADSYPVAALRRSAEGRAVVRLEIDPHGRVRGCTVATSSGDADLDGATCAIPLHAGRFLPARSSDGEPIASTYTLPVRWVLPRVDAPLSGAPRRRQATTDLPHDHRDWFERLMAAHHVLGLVTALLAIGTARIRRWLGAPDAPDGVDRWAGDRMPATRRRWRRRARTPGMRFVTALVPAGLLAVLLYRIGW